MAFHSPNRHHRDKLYTVTLTKCIIQSRLYTQRIRLLDCQYTEYMTKSRSGQSNIIQPIYRMLDNIYTQHITGKSHMYSEIYDRIQKHTKYYICIRYSYITIANHVTKLCSSHHMKFHTCIIFTVQIIA